MPKKKVDERVRTLIENGIKTRTRSLFVIVGDRGKDQVVNLHYILSKAQVKARPSVLWCYNKELGFSTCVSSSPDRARARARPRAHNTHALHHAHTRALPRIPQAPSEAHERDQEAAGQGPVRPRARRPL
jgi:tRNA(Met) C34 N-acetyltransferase TmcA